MSAEISQRESNRTLEGLNGVVCVADDIVMFGGDEEDHDAKLRLLMQKCHETGMKLNRNKCEFRLDEIYFMGHRVTNHGLIKT